MGAIDVNILLRSGDNGAPEYRDNEEQALAYAQTLYTTKGIISGYMLNFPAKSPWVTAVRATQGSTCTSVVIACSLKTEGFIKSGEFLTLCNP